MLPYPKFILGSETIIGNKKTFVLVSSFNMPGRPSHKVEVSLTNPLRSAPTFLSFYDKNENSREETKKFARVLFDATKSTSDNITQIEATPDNAFDMTSNFTSYEKSALVSNIVRSPKVANWGGGNITIWTNNILNELSRNENDG